MPRSKSRTCSTADAIQGAAGSHRLAAPSREAARIVMTDRWSISEAMRWADARPWILGFNFLPSTAVNFLEMWHRDTFDPESIGRELAWAGAIGFNAVRVNLPWIVWRHDRDGLVDRLDRMMDLAAAGGMATVPVFFDDCGFGGLEPEYGPQPAPVPGVHNSRAVASPGREAVSDRSLWPSFEAYVRDVVRRFRLDDRVLFWDIYNEPGNRMIFEPEGFREHVPDFTDYSIAMMSDAFAWARAENPVHPLTAAAWTTPAPNSGDAPYQTTADTTALAMSDIVTFHAYWDTAHVREFVAHLSAHRRPMMCTEWMARPVGSRIDDQLAYFRDAGIGCFQWGLVAGRTQTHLPWPAKLVAAHGGQADRSIWFHDLLHADGTPYDPREVETLRTASGAGKTADLRNAPSGGR